MVLLGNSAAGKPFFLSRFPLQPSTRPCGDADMGVSVMQESGTSTACYLPYARRSRRASPSTVSRRDV